MNKKYLIIALILATNSFGLDIEVESRIGGSISTGIEGLDINVDKFKMYNMIKDRKNIFNEDKSTAVDDFVANIRKIKKQFSNNDSNVGNVDDNQNNNKEDSDKKEKTNKLELPVFWDLTLGDVKINIKDYDAKIGIKLYSNPKNMGTIDKPTKGRLSLDLDKEYLKMNNNIYFKGYSEKISGLDRFRYDDTIENKKDILFESKGTISPFNMELKPELSYSIDSIGNLEIKPSIKYSLLNNKNESIDITASYRYTNYEDELLSRDEFKKDLINLAPGVDKVEYFKNWELNDERNIRKGYLNGKKGSIRAIGNPTGILYGENIFKYIINESLDNIKKDLDDRILSLLTKKDINLDDFSYLIEKRDKFIALDKKFQTTEGVLEFANPIIQSLFNELNSGKFKSNSSFSMSRYVIHNINYLANSNKEIVSNLNIEESNENSRIGIKVKKTNFSFVDDLVFAFPIDYLSEVNKVVSSKDFVESANFIPGLINELTPNINKYTEAGVRWNEIDKNYGELKNTTEENFKHRQDELTNELEDKRNKNNEEYDKIIEGVNTKYENEKKAINKEIDDYIATLKKQREECSQSWWPWACTKKKDLEISTQETGRSVRISFAETKRLAEVGYNETARGAKNSYYDVENKVKKGYTSAVNEYKKIENELVYRYNQADTILNLMPEIEKVQKMVATNKDNIIKLLNESEKLAENIVDTTDPEQLNRLNILRENKKLIEDTLNSMDEIEKGLELAKSIKKARDDMKTTIEDIKKTASDINNDFSNFNFNNAISGIANITKIINQATSTANIISGPLNELSNNINTIKNLVSKMSNMADKVNNLNDNIVNPSIDLLKPIVNKSINNINKMLNTPEKVENFDMFAGMHFLKSEYDVKREEFEKLYNKKIESYTPGRYSEGFNISMNYANKEKKLIYKLELDDTFNTRMNKLSLNNTLVYNNLNTSLFGKLNLVNKYVSFEDVKYNKFTINVDISLKKKFNMLNNKLNIFTGIRYLSDFEFMGYINAPEKLVVFERDNLNNLIKKEDAPITGNREFDDIKVGEKVDIRKFSKYLFDNGMDKYFMTKEKSGDSRWLKPIQYIVPDLSVVYNVNKNMSLDASIMLPLKFRGLNFDGLLLKNSLGLTLKF